MPKNSPTFNKYKPVFDGETETLTITVNNERLDLNINDCIRCSGIDEDSTTTCKIIDFQMHHSNVSFIKFHKYLANGHLKSYSHGKYDLISLSDNSNIDILSKLEKCPRGDGPMSPDEIHRLNNYTSGFTEHGGAKTNRNLSNHKKTRKHRSKKRSTRKSR